MSTTDAPDRPSRTSSSPSGRIAGHLGSGIGFLGWVLGLWIAIGAGDASGLTTETLPGAFLVSTGLWLVSILVIEGARARFGDRAPEVGVTVAGYLLVSIGLIAMLLHRWILPELMRSPGALDVLRATGSTTTVSWLWRLPPLALGSALLAWPAWRIVTAPRDS